MFLNKKSNRWQNVFINVPYFENKFEYQEKFFLKWFKRLESVKTHAE